VGGSCLLGVEKDILSVTQARGDASIVGYFRRLRK